MEVGRYKEQINERKNSKIVIPALMLRDNLGGEGAIIELELNLMQKAKFLAHSCKKNMNDNTAMLFFFASHFNLYN